MKLFSLLLAALIFSSQSFAQNRISQFPTTCVTIESLAEVLHQYKENPAMTMDSSRETNGKVITNKLVLFINFETKTWTMAEKTYTDRYCVIAIGENINPYFPK
jgi:hypothetical protein